MGVGPGGEDEPRPPGRGEPPPEAGGESPPEPARAGEHRDYLGVRGRVIAGVAFFLLYAVSFSLRGKVVAGLVGGILGGVLVYLVFKEAEARSRRRRNR